MRAFEGQSCPTQKNVVLNHMMCYSYSAVVVRCCSYCDAIIRRVNDKYKPRTLYASLTILSSRQVKYHEKKDTEP